MFLIGPGPHTAILTECMCTLRDECTCTLQRREPRTVFLTECTCTLQPLFLYLPYQSVHSPFQVPAKYERPYEYMPAGNRRKYLGTRRLLAPVSRKLIALYRLKWKLRWPISMWPTLCLWSTRYLGQVTALDEAVFNVTRTLEETGLWNNTILVFSTGTKQSNLSGMRSLLVAVCFVFGLFTDNDSDFRVCYFYIKTVVISGIVYRQRWWFSGGRWYQLASPWPEVDTVGGRCAGYGVCGRPTYSETGTYALSVETTLFCVTVNLCWC